MENDEFLQSILNADSQFHYPSGFLDEYCIMECLSEKMGIITFLVQDRHGENCIAKCYDRKTWPLRDNNLLERLDHEGLPKQKASFQSDDMLVTVREYIEGVSLDRYAGANPLSEEESVRICMKLCDILAYLHHMPEPVIHRDIKPENIIICPNGSVFLIDFDIARVYRADHESDTTFFGTRSYAPPEQYGFSQTDARTDIYSLGVLLRWMLTGSTKEEKKNSICRPLSDIIRKCTAFSPDERYSDVRQVIKALLKANPKAQAFRKTAMILCALTATALLVFGGIRLYRAATYSPFSGTVIPAVLSDGELIAEAVGYMKNRYGTTMFEQADVFANIGDLRSAMINLYGLDHDYVYRVNENMPCENDAFFLPWGWDDTHVLNRDVMVYAAVKLHDPAIVADWTSLKDDNGYYPGVRVAVAFAEKNGIMTGVNKPADITLGEMALILANADRVFEAAEKTAGK